MTIFFSKIDEQLFDILEDEQENAISELQLEQSRTALNDLSQLSNENEITNQAYLFPIKSKNKNRFLFNLTSHLAYNKLGEIDQPNSFLLTLRKKSQEQLDSKCRIMVIKKMNGDLELDQSSTNLVNMGNLKVADYKSRNLIKYNLNNLIINTMKTRSIQSSYMNEEQFVLFDTLNCNFDSAMITIEFQSKLVNSILL